ncbi:MAG: TraR/DksA C4-type zinc finger protein [Nitrospira sp.]|nr:TraR/DksA C4-type zinc finger protein [Nitrospira sp.]
MAHTIAPRRKQPGGTTGVARRATPPVNVRRADLWRELSRQRAVLVASANLSLAAESAAELYADPADQASTDLEHDVAMQMKVRTFERLRHIERALQLMRTTDYGQCRHCHRDIPYERLKVQPDALFCVPCLTTVEQKAAHN